LSTRDPIPLPIPLAQLVRKIDEVRALSNLPPLELESGVESEATLVAAAGSLLGEVERHKRRLIETTVLLGALSELLGAMLSAGDPAPALASLVHFLRGAFRLDWVHLALLDPETGCLSGPLVCGSDQEEVEEKSALLGGDRASLGEPLLTVLTEHSTEIVAGRAAAQAVIRHPRATALEHLVLLPIGQPGEGETPAEWGSARAAEDPAGEVRLAPVRGVLAVGRYAPEPVDGDHLTLLESLAGSIGTALDNARLTRRLREAMRFRQHVLESMIDGVVAVDRERRVLVMNEVAERLLDLVRSEAIGHRLDTERLVAADPPADPIGGALAGHPERRSEGAAGRDEASRRPVRFAATPLRDDQGQVVGALATFIDLTAIREMEQRIRHLDRIAALGRFTSSVAHEIRNPLAGIAAGIEYLGRGIPAGDKRRVHLEFVTREIGRLDRIVSDLSLASRPRAPQMQPVRIEVLVAEAFEAVESRPEARGGTLVNAVPAGLPPALVDPDQLSQVLLNLILNAVQAARTGRVTVSAGVVQEDRERGGRLEVAIEDTGPGVPAELRERIFEPFFTTKKEGTGLGLYLCHEMVERNGGEIAVQNRAGGGARFTVALRLAPPAAGVAEAA
jgi:two-component system, NtrC family, nitrogen regulation sensor histidine kinase GlnL